MSDALGCCTFSRPSLRHRDNETCGVRSKKKKEEKKKRRGWLLGIWLYLELCRFSLARKLFSCLLFSCLRSQRSSAVLLTERERERARTRMGDLPAGRILWILIFTGITGVGGRSSLSSSAVLMFWPCSKDHVDEEDTGCILRSTKISSQYVFSVIFTFVFFLEF